MKQHLAVVNKSNETIVSAEKQLARLVAERAKFQAAHVAAVQQAEALRTDAGRALALVAVGATDEAAARKLVSESDAADQRVHTIAMTLSGLAENEATAEATAAAARQQRAAATTAALDEHAETVAAEYCAAACVLIGLIRRLHALERARRTIGDQRAIFKSGFEARELRLPNVYGAAGDAAPCAGQYGELLYSALGELSHPDATAQGEANEAEVTVLSKAGLEL